MKPIVAFLTIVSALAFFACSDDSSTTSANEGDIGSSESSIPYESLSSTGEESVTSSTTDVIPSAGSGQALSDDSREGSSAASSSSVKTTSSSSIASTYSSSRNDNQAESNSVIPGTDPKSPSSSSVGDGGSEAAMTSSSSIFNMSSSTSMSSSSALKACEDDEEGWWETIGSTEYKCIDGYWIAQSSSSAASSSSYFDMTNQFSDKYSYGEFTDPRDGQVYKTITYEDGHFGIDSITIFAQNLNYGRMVTGGSVQTDSSKYCYNDDSWYCENGFGGLYSWSNAMNFPSACDSAGTGSAKCPNTFNLSDNGMTTHNSNYPEDDIEFVEHQGICPEGWHVMNRREWGVLTQKIGGGTYYSLMHSYYGSRVGSFGDNTYGFSLLPAGWWYNVKNDFALLEDRTLFWLHKEYEEDSTGVGSIDVGKSSYFSATSYYRKTAAMSVRCTKDY